MISGFLRRRNSLTLFVGLLALSVFLQACARTSNGGGHIPPPVIAVSVSPASVTVQTSATQTFSATVSNAADIDVTWQVNGVIGGDAAHGTISTGGMYTAPAVLPNPATVAVTAISVADSSKSGSSQVTVTSAPAISVTVSPSPTTIQTGIGLQIFTATLQNDTQSKGVTWTLSGAGCSGATCGALSSVTATTVTYSAPPNQPVPNTVTLTATAKADSTKTAPVTITLSSPVAVSVSPATFSLNVSRSKQFSATVSNDSQNKGVNWSLSGTGCLGATCGTVSATGLYTAPAGVPPGPVTITATAVADPTRTSTATVTILPAITVSVSPGATTVQTQQAQNFSATLGNDVANAGVTWSLSGASCSGPSCGTLSNVTNTTVTYTAPAAVPSPALVTLTATSITDNTRLGTGAITVSSAPNISVSVSPTTASLQASIGTQNFSATLQNDTQNKGVNWTLSGTGCSGATCGSLSNISTTAVSYKAPANAPSPNTVTLTATSIADGSKTAIAIITITSGISVTVSPMSFSVNVLHTKQFAATVFNDSQNKGVTWSVSGTGCSGAACGTISATGLYTAPAAVPAPAAVTITATSVTDTTRTSTATVTIIPAITVTVSPASASVQIQQTQNFTVTLANDLGNAGVTWSLSGTGCSGASCGSLSNVTTTSATYTAPTAVPSPATVALTATSITDNTKTNNATITVTAAAVISVTMNPTTASLQAGLGTQNFSVTLQNDTQNKGANWTLSGAGCSGATCGSLSNVTTTSVTYTAPANAPSPNAVTLTATSIADGTKTATAAITVTAAIGVSVVPPSATVNVNTTKNFTVTVSNDTQNKGVTWALSGSNCSGATCGTLSNVTTTSVTYTAPATPPPSNSTVTLTAKSIADTTRTGTASILVSSGTITISISPKRAGLTITQTLSLTATTTDAQGVAWSASGSGCSGNSCGTFAGSPSLTGVPVTYTAPSTAGVYTITATSVTDGTQSISITVGVTDLSGVTTWHDDLSRDGVNSQEYALTTSNVATTTFGKLFSCPVDGQVYAQPLWVANLTINGGQHNVIFAATQHDTLYAFDADSSPCTVLWQQSLLPAGETFLSNTDVGTSDINPSIGIVGTPVIDLATNTLYVVAKSKNGSGTYFQRLHAVSLIDHTERANSPALIASGGSGSFALIQNQRPGLVLNGNTIYVAWASHGDNGAYHGYVYSFDKTSLAQINTFNDTPTGNLGGIWMTGAAPAVDGSGNLYLITGNGTFNAANSNYGDSFLKLTSGLTVADYFTPTDQASDESGDGDFGSGGAAILVNSGPFAHLAIGGGKDSNLYVLNRDNMGHLGDTNAIQLFNVGGSIFSTAAFWQDSLYIAAAGTSLRMYPLNLTTSKFGGASFTSGTNFPWPGSTPSISSLGASNGIVWDTANTSPAILHAYDATNVSKELWNSSQAAGNRDRAGAYVKFTLPTVANGKVYIGTSSEVDVYGLLP